MWTSVKKSRKTLSLRPFKVSYWGPAEMLAEKFGNNLNLKISKNAGTRVLLLASAWNTLVRILVSLEERAGY